MGFENIKHLIAVGKKAEPADFVLKNTHYLNIFTDEFVKGDIAIVDGVIAGIGDYEGLEVVDVQGKTVVPGFVDAHIHIESASITPDEYAKTVVPHGTTAIFADPHEIVNVLGHIGMDYMLRFADSEIMDIFYNVPSCVPATPFDESGAEFTAEDIARYLPNKSVTGLAEMMNFPGVLECDPSVLSKLEVARCSGKIIDGHAPRLSGAALQAYSCAGVSSDHESTTMEEAKEKLRLGQWVFMREGSSAKNLNTLLPLLKNPGTSRRCVFATDDKEPGELKSDGHIDYIVRRAIQTGVNPATAFRAASFQGMKRFGIANKGAIAPGYDADLLVLNDMQSVSVQSVYKRGRLVAKDGALTVSYQPEIPQDLLSFVTNSVHMAPVRPEDFFVRWPAHVIGLVPGQVLTTDEGKTDRYDSDLVKVAIFERHKNTGHKAIAFLKGYGLRAGAIATTVAHDSHNVIVAGKQDYDMVVAVNRLRQIGGGMIAVKSGEILAETPLPIAGLMSDRPAGEVQKQIDAVKDAARSLGVLSGIDSLMTLSFVSLPVIPAIRLTTQGVFDVNRFALMK